MIWFRFGIDLTPFVRRKTNDKAYFYSDRQISKNKRLLISFNKFQNTEFSINLDTMVIGRDHGGLRFGIQVWRLGLIVDFYDVRRWDYKYDIWDEKYDLTEASRKE